MFGDKEHYLWCEKYRPNTLDGYVGNSHIIEKVKVFLQSGDVPHLLFFGSAGTGKCLDFSEKVDVEIELSDEEYEMLKKFEIFD